MLDIKFPASDLLLFDKALRRASTDLGKTAEQAITWGASTLTQSLGASTKLSKKLRPIVANPHPNAKTDKRRARWGVNRYNSKGEKYFTPIYRTGEFGVIRFVDKGKDGEPAGPSVKNSKKRIIGRRGMAKNVWKYARAHLLSGGVGNISGIPNIAEVKVNRSLTDFSITIGSSLRYQMDAFKTSGKQAIDTAYRRAARSMMKKIDQKKGLA